MSDRKGAMRHAAFEAQIMWVQ